MWKRASYAGCLAGLLVGFATPITWQNVYDAGATGVEIYNLPVAFLCALVANVVFSLIWPDRNCGESAGHAAERKRGHLKRLGARKSSMQEPDCAIIFDLDGVLTDTAELHYQSWQWLMDELRIPFDRDQNEALRGLSRDQSLEVILADRLGNTPPWKKRRSRVARTTITSSALRR